MRRRRRKADEPAARAARTPEDRKPSGRRRQATRRLSETRPPRTQNRELRARLSELTLAIARNPADVDALAERGRLWVALGDPEGALEDARMYLERAPDDPKAHALRGE